MAHHRLGTPSISIVLNDLLLILAHILLRNMMRSSTSGSSAQFSNMVFHSAIHQANIIVSVHVCVFFSKQYVVALSQCGQWAYNVLSLHSRTIHIADNHAKCLSSDLCQILSHHGIGTCAFQNLCNNGHKNIVEDLDLSQY